MPSVVGVVEASLAPPLLLAEKHPLQELQEDYGKLLAETALADVTFAVDGQRFPAHRCVLAARNPYFCGLFKSGTGMSEGGGGAAGKDIVIEGVSAGAFRTLLQFLYTNTLPGVEECGERLEVGEMARVADRFQAVVLYQHCVQQYREGLKVGNVVARLVLAHDSGLLALEEACMGFFETNAIVFQVKLFPAAFSWYTSVCVVAQSHVGTGAP